MPSIPPPYAEPFVGAIKHSHLWLWDSWVCVGDAAIDLYCLALARNTRAGAPILPEHRNDHRFHVRRFSSADGGNSWTDRGAAFAPTPIGDGFCARNVWSGSVIVTREGRRLHGFTGIRDLGPERPFLQTLFLACEDETGAISPPKAALLCPQRDYDMIREAGYYLGPRDRLGDADGEEGGPILTWRDPYLVYDDEDRLLVLWSAKIGPRTPAIGSAVLAFADGAYGVAELRAPMPLPDAETMTQAEVPKLYADPLGECFLLLISACDRLFEGQPDREVMKVQRLYRADRPTGPWRAAFGSESLVQGLDFVFGASLLGLEGGSATLIGPITEMASPEDRLTIGPLRHIAVR